MMKLYRPLSSDVTLRLTVDITPDADERDDVVSKFKLTSDGHNCSCVATTTSRTSSLSSSSSSSSPHNNNDVCCHGENCSSVICRTIHRCQSEDDNHSNHNNHHHHHHHHHNYKTSTTTSTNWYARHNTPDKVAKDIYNKEHLLHGDAASTHSMRTLPLDEFKRSVEEEGNDFKEVSLYDEMAADGDISDQTVPGYKRASTHPTSPKLTRSNSYVDAKLSGCFNDNARFQSSETSGEDGDVGVNEYRGGKGNVKSCYHGNGRKRRKSGRSSNEKDEENEEADGVDNDRPRRRIDGENEDEEEFDDDEDEEEEEEEEEDGDETLNMETDVSDEYDDDVVACAPEQLPIDLEEEVDMGDVQLMSTSMIESFYGEMDESMQASMIKPGTEVEPVPDEMSKSIAEEIHDVLIGDDDTKTDDVFPSGDCNAVQLPFPYPFTLKHAGHLFDKSRHHFTAASSKTTRTRTTSSTKRSLSDVISSPPADAYSISPSSSSSKSPKTSSNSPVHFPRVTDTKDKEKKRDCGEASTPTKKCSVTKTNSVMPLDLEVTHRGLHRFVPRHKDEITIGIGDPIHVIKECDDLWCEGINLRTSERGIFPAVYANDLTFLEESDDEDEYWKFSMRFLGSLEVTSNKGDDTLVQAIQKVAVTHRANIRGAPCSSLEISQYGIRMIDKSKEGHEKDAFSHFFALKNISFCGTHPKDNRYFAFITKHPRDYRFACHVFYGDRPTHRARDALGEAFKRFYQEYMAVTHPTEDIYIE